jgi:hypothetical protein
MKQSLFAKQLNKRRMRIQLIADAYARALKKHADKIAAIEAARKAAA